MRGNAKVDHDLVVGGWLIANNISGPNKGVFVSVDNLRTVYPHPQDGWWALVGTTLPAPLYVAYKGEWQPTGSTASASVIDAESYVADKTAVNVRIDELKNSIGQPEGIASLTGAGMVPHQQLYPDLRDVLPFSGFATGTLMLTDEGSSPAISGAGSVKLYRGKFVNVQRRLSPGVGGDIVIDIQEAHPSWSALQDVGGSLALGFYNASRFYGTETDTGVTPASGKIYLDTSDGGRPYVWNGTELVSMPVNTGEEAGQAYDGAAGAWLAARLDRLRIVPFTGRGRSTAPRVPAAPGYYFYAATADEPARFARNSSGIPGYDISDYMTLDADGEPVTVRADRLYLCGTDLYRYSEDLGDLISAGPAIPQEFVDEWLESGGDRVGYDRTAQTFSLDGHSDISHTMARRIMAHRLRLGETAVLPADIPVNMLVCPANNVGLYRHLGPVQLPVVLTGCGATTLRLGLDDAHTVGGVVATAIPVSAGTADNLAVASGYNSPLTRLLGWIEPRGGITWNIPGLTDIYLANLDYDQDFSWCGSLSFDSVRRMVNRKSSATPVTLRLHSTVYKRLTGADGTLSAAQAQQWAEVLAKAGEKQITFISA